MKKNGSALIFIFLMLSFISLLLTLFMRNSMLFYEFSLDRMKHARQRYALEALAHYAIALCAVEEKHESLERTLKTWPPPDGPYHGELRITSEKKQWAIEVVLMDGKKNVGSIKYHLKKDKSAFIISGWQSI